MPVTTALFLVAGVLMLVAAGAVAAGRRKLEQPERARKAVAVGLFTIAGILFLLIGLWGD